MRHLRRFLWFITVRLFGIAAICAMLIGVFYISMNITNIAILLNDGMAERARVITRQVTNESLIRKFFTDECISQDLPLSLAMSGNGTYSDYEIRSISLSIDVEWIWTWPWDATASATVYEGLTSIDGKIDSAKREAAVAARGDEALTVPSWAESRYRVTLTRIEGRWIISGIIRE